MTAFNKGYVNEEYYSEICRLLIMIGTDYNKVDTRAEEILNAFTFNGVVNGPELRAHLIRAGAYDNLDTLDEVIRDDV